MDGLVSWITGDLSRSARVWSALLPALVVASYFLIGLAVYAVRWAIKGHYRDAEIEGRGSSVLLGMWLRLYFTWLTRPLWGLVRLTAIPANAVTTLSFLLAIGSGVALADGRFALGGWLYIFSGICDFLDGRLARESGKASKSGAALDSVLDRYADGAVLCGLAWYYRDSWVLVVAVIALIGSMLVSYVRARGEGLGVQVKGVGVMQRAERIMYLGVATVFSPVLEAWLDPTNPKPLHRLAVAGLVLLAVTTQWTALRRLLFVLKSLGANLAPPWLKVERRRAYPLLAAASIATAGDFLTMLLLVERGLLTPGLATAVGCGVGALINAAAMSRLSARHPEGPQFQLGHYGVVSLASTVLNASGVALLLAFDLHFVLAWLLVRAVVFTAWNFPLHVDYVFVEGDRAGTP